MYGGVERDHASPRAGLRVAVIGAGARSEIALHVPRIEAGARVAAVVEPTDVGRHRAAAMFPSATIHPDLESLIRAGDTDAAIVTTPDDTHAEIAIRLLEAGIAVYLEKPMATTLTDADRILATAVRMRGVVYVGHNFRHASVVRVMKKVIDDGLIGEVKAVWVRHFVGNGGDYYFKDWHADRSRTNTLLLQKASHDIDAIHYLAGGHARRVVGMGALMIYGDITDRRDRSGQTMPDWFSLQNWPPGEATGLNPVVDVEDVSMMMMTLDNGVLASYEQCHFTPDYWRNYTVIGTHGRLENCGDAGGGRVRVWNTRREWSLEADHEFTIDGESSGHEDADVATLREFFELVLNGGPTVVSAIAARAAVAAGDLAAQSLRSGSIPRDVPKPDSDVIDYFTSAVGG